MAKKKISLAIYALSIFGKNNQRLKLNNIDEGKIFLECVENYIHQNIRLYTRDTNQDTLFQFEQVSLEKKSNSVGQEEYSVLYGRVKTGEYGIESELVNVKSGQITNRSVDQADMMPFGFCVAVPAGDVNSGVIILQTMGVYGMKTTLQRHLQICLTDVSPDLH